MWRRSIQSSGWLLLTPFREKISIVARKAAAASAGTLVRTVARATAKVEALIEPAPTAPPPAAPPEPGRLHFAEKPHLLGLPGWGEVALKVWSESSRDRLFLVAAGVAFFTLLALFPALSALIAVWSLFGDPAKAIAALGEIAFILPPGGVDLMRNQAELVGASGRGNLTTYITFGIGISIWSANAGMKSMFDAMNIIYDEEEKRGFFALNFRSLLFTLGALAVFLASLAVIVAVPVALAWLNMSTDLMFMVAFVRWPALLAITIVFLTLLNRYGPSRPPQRSRWSLWGSTLGACMWLTISLLFSFYVGHIANLTATYGSLAVIAGLMTWLWLSALVILVGIELNAELERRSDRWEEARRIEILRAAPSRRTGLRRIWDRVLRR